MPLNELNNTDREITTHSIYDSNKKFTVTDRSMAADSVGYLGAEDKNNLSDTCVDQKDVNNPTMKMDHNANSDEKIV